MPLAVPTCPKCARPGPWLDEDDDDKERARDCATSADFWGEAPCPYEACDQPECRAKREPVTLEEYRQTLEHWRNHTYLSGCSHGT